MNEGKDECTNSDSKDQEPLGGRSRGCIHDAISGPGEHRRQGRIRAVRLRGTASLQEGFGFARTSLESQVTRPVAILDRGFGKIVILCGFTGMPQGVGPWHGALTAAIVT